MKFAVLLALIFLAEPQVAAPPLPLSQAVASGQPDILVTESGTLTAPLVMKPQQRIRCLPGVIITCQWGTDGNCIELADGCVVQDCTLIGEWTGPADAGVGYRTGMHGIACYGSKAIGIAGVSVKTFHGDGFYAGPLRDTKTPTKEDRAPCEATVTYSQFANNYRQGSSVVSGVVMFESVQFLDTAGVSPQAGLDVEPSNKWDTIDVTVHSSVSSGNKGSPYFINLDRATAETPPIRIVFVGCTAMQFTGWTWLRTKGVYASDGFPRGELPKTLLSVNGFEMVNK